MHRIGLLFSLVAAMAVVEAPVFGAGHVVHLRTGGPGGVEIAGCTSSSPVTCTTRQPHGFKTGDLVGLENVLGLNGVNGARHVSQVPSPTSFTVDRDAEGKPLTISGAWRRGGGLQWTGKVAPFELRDHPRGILDGPQGRLTRALRCAVDNACLEKIEVSGGTATAVMPGGPRLKTGDRFGVWNASAAGLNGVFTVATSTDTGITFPVDAPDGEYREPLLTVSAYAWAGNPAWDLMQSVLGNFGGEYRRPNVNVSFEKYLMAALVWFTDRSSPRAATNLAIALHGLEHVEDIAAGSMACDESVKYCNGRADSVDYGRTRLVNAAAIYSLLASAGEIQPAAKQTFLDKVFNDKADGCRIPANGTGAGIVTATGRKVRGAGTRFTADLAPGDTLWLPNIGGEDAALRVESIESDTELTLNAAKSYTGPYQVTKAWAPGDCGVMFLLKHHPSSLVTHPSVHATDGGIVGEGGGTSFYHNLPMTAVYSHVVTGMILAREDPRAQRLLEGTWMYGYDHLIGYAMNSWTGFTQAGGTYHWFRSPWMAAATVYALRSSLDGYPDLRGEYFVKNTLPLDVFAMVPFGAASTDNDFFIQFGEGSVQASAYRVSFHATILKLFEPEDRDRTGAGLFTWWLKNRYGYTAQSISWNQGQGAPNFYLSVDPNDTGKDNREMPTQRLFNQTDYETCQKLGMLHCNDRKQKYALAISRTGWEDRNDTMVQIYSGTYQEDHFENQAGDYRIIKGDSGAQPCLMGGDSSQCATAYYNGLRRNNLIEVGPENFYARKNAGLTGPVPLADFERWASDRTEDDRAGVYGDSKSRYVYALANTTEVFTPAAGVRRAWRHFAHFKKPGAGEYLVVYDDVDMARPSAIRGYSHYAQNGQQGEGATTCEGGCDGASLGSRLLVSKSPTNTIVTRYQPVDPATRFRLYVNGPNGKYEGGNGYTFRATYCATADDTTCSNGAARMEAIIVHRIVAGTGDTSLTTRPLGPQGWTGVETGDAVALFARHGATPNEVRPFKTEHSGTARYLVAGLAPGTYDVFRDGVAILTAWKVVAGDNSLYFESESGTFHVAQASRAEGGGEPEPPGEEPGAGAAGGVVEVAALELGGPAVDGVSVETTPDDGMRRLTLSEPPLTDWIAADTLQLDWGPPESEILLATASAPCREGCDMSLDVAANSVLYLRKSYRLGETVVLAQPPKSFLVP